MSLDRWLENMWRNMTESELHTLTGEAYTDAIRIAALAEIERREADREQQ